MGETEKLKGLEIEAQLLIHADDAGRTVAFNEEIAALCGKVEESNSIYSAAAEVGMSYGKAWRLVKNVEAALGFPLFARGGCKGSALTPEAKKLLATWTEVQRRINANAANMLQETFSQPGKSV